MMDKTRAISDERVKAVGYATDYIEKNLGKQLCLDEIAEHSGYSKYHLNRLFKAQTGCTLFKFIQQRRLEQAAKALVATDRPVVEIAMDACYGSQQAFTLAFRHVYHVAPLQYRLRQRQISGMLRESMLKNSILSRTLNFYSQLSRRLAA